MIIKVKVISNSSEDKIVGFEYDILKIKCTVAPKKGKANQAVIAMLAKYYRVPKNAIKILKGKTSSQKIIEIKN
jgi:uncharacterized protein